MELHGITFDHDHQLILTRSVGMFNSIMWLFDEKKMYGNFFVI